MDKEPGRWVTLGEAAHYFKVSERTIRRRIKAGQLRTQHSGGRVLVLVYGLADSVADMADATPVKADTSDKWQAEAEKWRTLAEEREATIKELWSALAREQAVNMAAAQKLIEARTGGESKPARRWWWPWGKG